MNAIRWQFVLWAVSTMLLSTIAVVAPATAGSFKVNPVNLEIQPDRTTTSVSLTNSASEPVSVRAVAYRWNQVDGLDVYQKTTNVIISPPIFTLGRGKTQLIRVGVKLRRPDEAYRVIFEEIPHAQLQANAVQVALRLDLPLFVEPSNAEPRLSWQAWQENDGAITLEAANAGGRHQRILSISLNGPTNSMSLLTRETGVVLAKSSRRWRIGNEARISPGTAVQLVVGTPKGEEQQSVVVQQR